MSGESTQESSKWRPSSSQITQLVWISCLAIITVAFMATSFREVHIKTVAASVTVLTSTAQVSATLSGFLLVGLVFLVSKSSFSFRTEKWYMVHFDLVILGLAMVFLAVNSLNCLSSLTYALSQDQMNERISGAVTTATVLVRTAFILFAIGVGGVIGRFLGEAARTKDVGT